MARTLQEILDSADDLAAQAAAYVPSPDDERDPASWHALRQAVDARATAEQQVAEAVVKMRHAGYSWAVIGGLLGTSAQAAHQRYSTATKAAAAAVSG